MVVTEVFSWIWCFQGHPKGVTTKYSLKALLIRILFIIQNHIDDSSSVNDVDLNIRISYLASHCDLRSDCSIWPCRSSISDLSSDGDQSHHLSVSEYIVEFPFLIFHFQFFRLLIYNVWFHLWYQISDFFNFNMISSIFRLSKLN